MFNQLKPQPEHLSKLLACLEDGEQLSPNEIVKRSGLSLTATYGAIDALEAEQKIEVIRQNKTPKMQVRLSKA